MKKFTKIMLIFTGILLSAGIVCILVAIGLGLKSTDLNHMYNNGQFSIHLNNLLDHTIGNSNPKPNSTNTLEFSSDIKHLDIELGAGNLAIVYDDVDKIIVEATNLSNLEAEIEEDTLCIEEDNGINIGFNFGINNTSNASLTITLPKDFALDNVSLTLGASKADIEELRANALDIEVGAGSAEIKKLDIQSLDVEVGVGELTLGLVDQESDYNLDVKCGVGSVKFGGHSYSSLGASESLHSPTATRILDIECGVGEVEINFVD